MSLLSEVVKSRKVLVVIDTCGVTSSVDLKAFTASCLHSWNAVCACESMPPSTHR